MSISFRDARTAISRIGKYGYKLADIYTEETRVFFLLSTGSSCVPVVFQLMLDQIVTILTEKKAKWY